MELEEYARVAGAEDDHWWYRSTRALMADLLAPWLGEAGGMFLDAGCGPGGNGAWLARHGDLVGVDLAGEALRFVQTRHPSTAPVQATLDALPFPKARFDVVVEITVLTSVPDDVRAAAELARVARPGGAVLLIEPAFESLRRGHDATVHARRRYRLADLTALVDAAGLEVRRATYAYSFLAVPAAALALAWRLRPRPVVDAGSDVERGSFGGLFGRLAGAERRLLSRRRIPFGTSALVLAAKPPA